MDNPFEYEIKYAVLPANKIKNALKPSDQYIDYLNELQGFFIKLELSILKEGFRNPIAIKATNEKVSNIYLGGSRLMIAQKHNLDIPCIICDFDNVFPEAKVLNTIEEIRSYFTDQPVKLLFNHRGIKIGGCEHVHLKDEE